MDFNKFKEFINHVILFIFSHIIARVHFSILYKQICLQVVFVGFSFELYRFISN